MLAIIMTIIFVLSMAVTGCSGASEETDSGGGKTETETEAPAADDQQAEEGHD